MLTCMNARYFYHKKSDILRKIRHSFLKLAKASQQEFMLFEVTLYVQTMTQSSLFNSCELSLR